MTSATTIETIVVTVNDQVLHSASFASKPLAAAYRRGVRGWAGERGLNVRLWTQQTPLAAVIPSCEVFAVAC